VKPEEVELVFELINVWLTEKIGRLNKNLAMIESSRDFC
jgi:hypothetical protein